jgi:hypothetical protein
MAAVLGRLDAAANLPPAWASQRRRLRVAFKSLSLGATTQRRATIRSTRDARAAWSRRRRKQRARRMVGTPRRASRRQLVPDAREEAGGSRRCRETARLLVRPCLPPESSAWPNALRDVASICPLAEQTQPLLPAASPCMQSFTRRWSLQRCAAYLTRPTALNLQPATPKQQQHDLTAHHALPHRHPRRVLVLRGVGVTRALSPSPHASFPQPAVHPCDRGP